MRRKTSVLVFGALVLLGVTHLATPTYASRALPEKSAAVALAASLTLNPVADAHVNQAYATTNYGGDPELKVDGDPSKRSFLRFTVTGLSGTVSQATLRVYANTALASGANVYRVADNTWSESGVTHANAPALGGLLGSTGAIASGTWVSVNVTPYVTGNGTYSFGLTSGSAGQVGLASREAGNKPQLVVTTVAATPTAVAPTATAVPPTATPGGTSGTVTVNPVADAHVNQAYASTNYGTATSLKLDSQPAKRGYVRFNVVGVSGAVTRATLRVYATSSLSAGYAAQRVADNSWEERAITFNTAPAVGSVLGTSGAVSAGRWTAIDVTGYVTGNGTYSFALTTSNATGLSLASREAANRPQLVVTTGTVSGPTATVVAPTATPTKVVLTATPTKVPPTATPTRVPPTSTPISGNVRILCDGKVFDGYGARPFQLDSATDKDPNILKVIRNCVFRNSKEVAIAIKDARNVLIEGNVFENIRTHVAGDGVHAINITGPSSGSVISDITIRNNTFKAIGADGIQLGQNTRYIRNIYIQNNEFVGGADVGENAIDVKGVEGPVSITGNKVHGFRPCESPKKGGNQDCSGSPGEGIVVHDGGSGLTAAYNVTVENNDIWDNTLGLVISSGARNGVARGNRVSQSVKTGILLSGAVNATVTGNTLTNNPTHISISGSSCTVSGNTFIGGGASISGSCN